MRHHSKYTHFTAGLLIVVFLLLSLAGCGKKDGQTTTVRVTKSFKENDLFFLDTETCTVQEAKLFLLNERSQYRDRYGEEIWNATYEGQHLYEFLNDGLKKFLVRMKCIDLMAPSQEVTLSSEDMTLINMAADACYERMTEEVKAYTQATKEDLVTAYSDYYLANKVYRVLTANASHEISEDEARVIELQCIYLPKTQENALEEINELHDRATGGEDFTELSTTSSRGDWNDKLIMRGELEAEVEQAAFAMNTGTISKVVEASDGYYVFYCVSNNVKESTDLHREELMEEWKQELFQSLYDEFVVNLYLRFNDDAWKQIDFSAATPEGGSVFMDCYQEFLAD